MTSRTSSQRSSQFRLSPEARYCAIRSYEADAERIAEIGGKDFREESFQWCEAVGKLKVLQLIDLGLAMDAADPNENADSPVSKRLKALREVITSLIHRRNSSHLEGVIKRLDASTKQLDTTMLALTVVGTFLAAVQVLTPASYTRPWMLRLLGVGLGIALLVALVLLKRRRTSSQA